MRRKSNYKLVKRSKDLQKQNPKQEIPASFNLTPENIRNNILQINSEWMLTISGKVLVTIS